jgi:hypothetical protein
MLRFVRLKVLLRELFQTKLVTVGVFESSKKIAVGLLESVRARCELERQRLQAKGKSCRYG